jgi:hypothetical protein
MITPTVARLVRDPFDREGWLFERKWLERFIREGNHILGVLQETAPEKLKPCLSQYDAWQSDSWRSAF